MHNSSRLFSDANKNGLAFHSQLTTKRHSIPLESSVPAKRLMNLRHAQLFEEEEENLVFMKKLIEIMDDDEVEYRRMKKLLKSDEDERFEHIRQIIAQAILDEKKSDEGDDAIFLRSLLERNDELSVSELARLQRIRIESLSNTGRKSDDNKQSNTSHFQQPPPNRSIGK